MDFLKKKYLKEWKSLIALGKQELKFGKNEMIFSAGDKTNGIYSIKSGYVKISYKNFDGEDLVIRIAGKGDTLGHRGFGGDWTYPISAYSLNESEVTFLPIEVFKTMAKTNPEFSFDMMMFFADELRKSEKKISQPPVLSRIAYTILENYRVFGFDKNEPTKLAFTLSRSDISNMAGTTYESVIRSLSELKKKGVIQISGKNIHILDLKELENIANPAGD
ncbi:MAG: Crp/Fnr family transcriptional regulator [Crocinitomicaceae bacterium]|nr:Crp/Fnr family transcriptional regulator [Crocinitomicaceae bacterium]